MVPEYHDFVQFWDLGFVLAILVPFSDGVNFVKKDNHVFVLLFSPLNKIQYLG